MAQRMVRVQNKDGEVFEVTMANARDCVRSLGFKFYSKADEPVEQEQIVGEQKAVEDAITPKDGASEADPSPEDLAPKTAPAEDSKADMAKAAAAAASKSKAKGKS